MRQERLKTRCLVAVLCLAMLMPFIPLKAEAETGTATDAQLEARYDGITIQNNVLINGQNMGGLSYADAAAQVKMTGDLSSVDVNLTSEYGDIVCTLGELGISDNTASVLKEAFEYGNTGNILKRYREKKQLETTPIELTTKKTIDGSIIGQMVESNLSAAMNKLSDYSISRDENGAVSVTAEGQSVSADSDATAAAVEDIINADGYDGSTVSTKLVISNNSENERLKQLKNAILKNLI